MMKQFIIVMIVFVMMGFVSCTKKTYHNEPITVQGTIQRIYSSSHAVDLLDADGVEWKVMIAFDLPIQKPSETPLYFDQLNDFDFLSVKGKRLSEFEIEANEVWSTIPPTGEETKDFTYNLYFTNPSLAEDENRCDEVFSVQRSIKGSIRFDLDTKINLVLTELLQGPTQDETLQDYNTSLPADAEVNAITYNPDTNICIIDFSSLSVAGSCNVQAARKQMEDTFLQFEEIQDVKILLNGIESEALQP
ncbi:MAG: GerMN domain-containing protein [Caldisericia bacterium]|nr:GerMN domain-containing protein [Caldisericia bacterium]MDD4614613.1 GerMN domain-containing protein [Caldisericia bacterium]